MQSVYSQLNKIVSTIHILTVQIFSFLNFAEVLRIPYPQNTHQTFRSKASEILKRSSSLRGGRAYKCKKDCSNQSPLPALPGMSQNGAQNGDTDTSDSEAETYSQKKKKKTSRHSSDEE